MGWVISWVSMYSAFLFYSTVLRFVCARAGNGKGGEKMRKHYNLLRWWVIWPFQWTMNNSNITFSSHTSCTLQQIIALIPSSSFPCPFRHLPFF